MYSVYVQTQVIEAVLLQKDKKCETCTPNCEKYPFVVWQKYLLNFLKNKSRADLPRSANDGAYAIRRCQYNKTVK